MTLLEAIMNKEECSEAEAEEIIQDLVEECDEGLNDPEEVLYNYGLEADYVIDLLDRL